MLKNVTGVRLLIKESNEILLRFVFILWKIDHVWLWMIGKEEHVYLGSFSPIFLWTFLVLFRKLFYIWKCNNFWLAKQ